MDDLDLDTLTVGQLREALKGLPADTPVLVDEHSGWVTTLPVSLPRDGRLRASRLKGRKVLLIPTSDRAVCVNADATGGPVSLP